MISLAAGKWAGVTLNRSVRAVRAEFMGTMCLGPDGCALTVVYARMILSFVG